jgi:hypothetical protein
MPERTNVTLIVPDGPFARMRAITDLADVLDPAHGPHGLLDALEALGDGTLLHAAADAVNEALGCIPAEYRAAGE